MKNENSKNPTRRKFLKNISSGSALAVSGLAYFSVSSCKQVSEEKTTLLTTDGKLVQVSNSEIEDKEEPNRQGSVRLEHKPPLHGSFHLPDHSDNQALSR